MRTTSSSSAPRRRRSGRSERPSPSRSCSVVVPALLFLALALFAATASGQFQWPQWPLHTIAGNAVGELTGWCVCLTRDMNGDGKGEVAVASPGDDTTFTNAGAVRVYAGGTWTLLHAFLGANPLDQFGKAIATGDINLDGHADLIVGVPDADPGGVSMAGVVYVYSGLDGSLLHQFDGNVPNGQLGFAVASDDVDGDGHDDVIANQRATYPPAGAVHAYSGATGALIRTIWGEYGSAFGVALAADDFDLDGYSDVAVGSPGWGGTPGLDGRIRVYSGLTGAILHDWIGTWGQGLGYRVARGGDTNGDGFPDLLASNGSSSSQVVYVYSGATGQILHAIPSRREAYYPVPPWFTTWGSSLSAAGDVDGDGFGDIIIASDDDLIQGLCCPGTVTVASGLTGLPLYVFQGTTVNDAFGKSVSGGIDVSGSSGPEIVIGAPEGYLPGGMGYAMIFDPVGPPAAWSQPAGTGCGPGAAPPVLVIPSPFLGQSRPIAVSGASPSASGILFVSSPPYGITPLAGSCSLALDPATVTPFLAFTTSSSGFWSTTFALPPDPAWAGTRLALQGALYPSLSPLGADLTNGVHIQLGW